MPRKNFGMLDEALMDRVDAEAKRLGQTRRMVTERALERELSGEPQRQREAIQSALQDLERGQMRYAIATLEAALGDSDLSPIELTGVAAERAEAILARTAHTVESRPAMDRTSDFRRVTQPTARAGKR